MNAAARLVNQSVLSRTGVLSVVLSRTHFMLVALLLSVLTSALSIVYVTNASRSLNASVQQVLAERSTLHVQWGQLLLEKSTRVIPARVQHVAEDDLGMVVPDRQSVVMIKE
jgi:cell division protein FtsL